MKKISRREFLKLTSLTGSALLASNSYLQAKNLQHITDLPNIVIFVFDAMSARNMSLYGYPRNTTPNLEEFAQQATVYHSHYAGGNFTSPGTASLLTGTYPWKHGAFNLVGLLRTEVIHNNIFNAAGKEYFRTAFSQNLWPNYFFEQFQEDLDLTMDPGSFSAINYDLTSIFKGDRQVSYRAQDFLAPRARRFTIPSLLFGTSMQLSLDKQLGKTDREQYPGGLPQAGKIPFLFRLNDVFDGIWKTIYDSRSPYISYLHIMAPHAPYRPSKQFHHQYKNDSFVPILKPNHRFDATYSQSFLNNSRNNYDAYIANLDAEFGRLLKNLRETGFFKNSFVIVTSDHGEMFERGVFGHVTKLLNEPCIHIPLIVSAPNQTQRRDVFAPTNNVDILPTIAKLTGSQQHLIQFEGQVLPDSDTPAIKDRSLFTMEAKENSAFSKLSRMTIAMRKNNFKLIYYTGYEADDFFEAYNILEDPEELNDLYSLYPVAVKKMKDELLEKINDINILRTS